MTSEEEALVARLSTIVAAKNSKFSSREKYLLNGLEGRGLVRKSKPARFIYWYKKNVETN